MMNTPQRVNHHLPAGIAPWVALLLALLTVGLSGACGKVTHTAEEHLERGTNFEQQGDLAAASIEYRNALQQDPTSARGRFLLGMLFLKVGDTTAAADELQRAKDLGWDADEVRLQLIRVALLQGRYGRVMDETRLLESFPETHAPEALALRGQALLGIGNPSEAANVLGEALALRPENLEAQLGMGTVAVQRGDGIDVARDWIEKALETDPQSSKAWIHLGDLERLEGRLLEAEAAYGRAIPLSPSPHRIHLNRALTRIGLGDIPGAEKDLSAMRRLAPADFSNSYIQGLVHYHQQRLPEAQASFQEVLNQAPAFQPALFFLGATNVALEQWRQAEQNLQRVLNTHPQFDEAARLLAIVRLRENNPAAAEALLRPILQRNPADTRAISLLGNAHLAQGRWGEAADYLRQTSAARPEDASLRAALGMTLMQAGDEAAGIEELESAAEQAPDDVGLEVGLIMSLIRSGQYANALVRIDKLQERVPDSAMVHNLRAAVHMEQGDLSGARAALQEALQVAPGDPAASTNLARIEHQAGNLGEAARIYREALHRNPGQLGLMTQLAKVEAERGNFAEMRSLLQNASAEHPDALSPRLILARYHLSINEPRRALELIEPIREAAGDDPEWLDVLARGQLAIGQTEQALSALRRLAERSPATADASHHLGQLFEQAGRPDEARAHYQKALEREAGHPDSLRSLALLALEAGQSERALPLARQLQGDERVAVSGYLIEGRAHTAEGRHDAAVAAFQRAYELGPSAEHAVVLAIAHQRQGDAHAATELLAARLEEHPDELVVRFHFANAAMMKGDHDVALREYEALLAAQVENVVILNNLAVLYQTRDEARALDYAERAYRLQPTNPAIADTLGWVLINRGELDRGLALLETARTALPERADVRYHYAVGLSMAGRNEEAKRELKELLGAADEFTERAQAEALHRSLQQ